MMLDAAEGAFYSDPLQHVANATLDQCIGSVQSSHRTVAGRCNHAV